MSFKKMFMIKKYNYITLFIIIIIKERKLGRLMFVWRQNTRELPSPSLGCFPGEGRGGTSPVLWIFPAFYPRPAGPPPDRESCLH